MVVDMYEREVGAVKISFRIICYKGLHEETKAALAAFIAHFHGQILSMGDTAELLNMYGEVYLEILFLGIEVFQ